MFLGILNNSHIKCSSGSSIKPIWTKALNRYRHLLKAQRLFIRDYVSWCTQRLLDLISISKDSHPHQNAPRTASLVRVGNSRLPTKLENWVIQLGNRGRITFKSSCSGRTHRKRSTKTQRMELQEGTKSRVTVPKSKGGKPGLQLQVELILAADQCSWKSGPVCSTGTRKSLESRRAHLTISCWWKVKHTCVAEWELVSSHASDSD